MVLHTIIGLQDFGHHYIVSLGHERWGHSFHPSEADCDADTRFWIARRADALVGFARSRVTASCDFYNLTGAFLI